VDDFEAELARRLRAPIDEGVDTADDILVRVERRRGVQRRMVVLAVAAGGVAMLVAILFGVWIAEDALPMMQIGSVAWVALRVPFAIAAAVLTLAAGTIAALLLRMVR